MATNKTYELFAKIGYKLIPEQTVITFSTPRPSALSSEPPVGVLYLKAPMKEYTYEEYHLGGGYNFLKIITAPPFNDELSFSTEVSKEGLERVLKELFSDEKSLPTYVRVTRKNRPDNLGEEFYVVSSDKPFKK